MRKLLTIALIFLATCVSAQSPQYIVWPGEYQCGYADIVNMRFGSGNIGGAVGNSSPGTNGKPGLLCPGQIAGSGATLDSVTGGSSCLHSQFAIRKGILYGTGINDNHSLGLGGSAGNQSQFTAVTQDSMGHVFNNITGCFASANTFGSFCLAWKSGAQGDTLWAAGLLEGGIRGNGSNPTTDNGYFVPITGFDAGDTIIDAKGDAILMVLTKNGTGVRKIYTSGNSSSFTGNGTSDLTLHKLTGLAATPKQIDLGVYWFAYLGTDGNLYGWGFNYQTWCGTLGSSPTTPTNVMTNIGLTAGSISSFGFGDICTYAILNTGYLYGWGDDVCSSLGINPKPHWNTYGSPPLYGASKTPWAWDQDQTPVPLESGVVQAKLLDSCHTYLAVYAGHTFGCYTIAEDINHVLHSLGRNKAGVQANGVYDQQYITGNPESIYPNGQDTASRSHLGLDMIFPFNDVAGVARHSPYCDTLPTATYCSSYTYYSEAPPTVTGWSNQTITSTSTSFSPTITAAGGHTVNNIRVSETTLHGCPTSTIAQPYSATTTISGLTTGTHTIQIIATDDQYKQTTVTATITVGGSIPIGPISPGSGGKVVLDSIYSHSILATTAAYVTADTLALPPNSSGVFNLSYFSYDTVQHFTGVGQQTVMLSRFGNAYGSPYISYNSPYVSSGLSTHQSGYSIQGTPNLVLVQVSGFNVSSPIRWHIMRDQRIAPL
jgi:hypothetical protein